MTTLLSIQEMAARSGLSRDTLRYYERVGLLRAVQRSGSGHRRYAAADVAWVEFLLRLRATGMPIARMCEFAQLRQQGDASMAERLDLLLSHHQKVTGEIVLLQENLAVIEQKIAHYRAQLPHHAKDEHHDLTNTHHRQPI